MGLQKNSGGMNKASNTNLFCNPCSKEHWLIYAWYSTRQPEFKAMHLDRAADVPKPELVGHGDSLFVVVKNECWYKSA